MRRVALAVPAGGAAPTARPGRAERGYAALLVLGVALPYAQAVPWLVRHGADPSRFLREVSATRVSRFFGWDVAVTSLTCLALAGSDDELSHTQRAAVAAGALAGPSVALPLHLWLRERTRRRAAG